MGGASKGVSSLLCYLCDWTSKISCEGNFELSSKGFLDFSPSISSCSKGSSNLTCWTGFLNFGLAFMFKGDVRGLMAAFVAKCVFVAEGLED